MLNCISKYFKTSVVLDQGDPGATTSGAIDLLAQKSFIYQYGKHKCQSNYNICVPIKSSVMPSFLFFLAQQIEKALLTFSRIKQGFLKQRITG